MKKTALLIAILFSGVVYSQENFKWDKLDSVQKTKAQIYSDTKLFIANVWKSASNVVKDDDKEAGVILVKGASIQKVNHSMNVFTYIYNYTVTFKMKDNKYKITIDNVYCESAYPVGNAQYSILKIEPFDGQYIKGKTSMVTSTLPEKKALEMMANFKAELQAIVDSYEKQIKKANASNGNW